MKKFCKVEYKVGVVKFLFLFLVIKVEMGIEVFFKVEYNIVVIELFLIKKLE